MTAPELEIFADRIGQEFTISDERASFRATLAEATTIKSSFPGRQSPSFQLQFQAADHSISAFWPQRIYTISHDELDPMEVFLVPVGPPRDGSGGFRYQAVFH